MTGSSTCSTTITTTSLSAWRGLAQTPTVTTTHGRLDLQEVRRFYQLYPEQRLVSISHDQRKWLPDANWVGTVHNGIAVDHFRLRQTPGDYLVFLGRISPREATRPGHRDRP